MGILGSFIGRVCQLVVIFACGISSVFAEGVFHLGSTLNQPLSSSTNIFVHVPNDGDIIRVHLCRQDGQANAVTADIYNTTVNASGLFTRNIKIADLDSPQANISCSDPMTSPLPRTTATGNVMEFVVPTAGVYSIDLDTPTVEYFRWDFSVVSGSTPNADVDATANPGNLFSYQWQFFTRDFVKSVSATGQMYILVPGGFPNTNYVWALDLQEFSGNRYDIVANDIGLNDPVSGISAPVSGNSVTPQYPVYLNYPNGANPQPAPVDFPTLTDSLTFVDDNGNDSVISPDGDAIEETGNFSFTPDVSGTYAITIDINRDGEFGANDRLLLGRMTANVLSVVNWDGTDASGATVPNASYPVRLELRVGEYHFVARDAETSGGGSNDDGAVNEGGSGENDGLTILQATDANTLTPTQIYWDDETLLGGDTNLPNGILSSQATNGAHRHTWGTFTSGGIGNEAFIDTSVFGNSTVLSVTAIVASANTAPTIDDGTFSVDENSSVNTLVDQVTAADVDLDFLSFTITAGNIGDVFSIDDLSGEIRVNGSLDADLLDQYVLTVRVTDQANEAFATITININNINEGPSISGTPLTTIAEDTTYSFTPSASDPESDPLTFSVSGLPTWALFDTNDGTISGVPDNDDVGLYENIIVTVASAGPLSASLPAFSIQVTNVNDAPVAVNDSASTNEDSSVTISVLTNDSDPENDALTVASASASNGTVVINANGSLSYTPTLNFNGNDLINYSINDGNGGSDSATVSLSVVAVNDAPVAVNDSASTNEDNSVTISVLTNDSDVDGDPISVTGATATSGTVVINPDGSIIYTPFDDFNGTDSITYTISDGNGGTNSATVLVTVNSINDGPVASNDAATTIEDNSININALVNDNDVDGDTLSIVATSSVSNGSLSFTATQITFTPANNFNGNVTFNYTISDGLLESNANITISITPDNDLPVALNDVASTEENNSVVVNVLNNDSDIDVGDVLTVISASAANGNASINPDQTLTYTPNSSFSGSDTIGYTISDGNNGEASAVVNVTVVPLALTISGAPATSIFEGASYSFVPFTSASASASLIFSVTGLPGWANFNPATGEITGTPERADVGIYPAIIICVTDGNTTECLSAFEIEVIGDLDQDGIPDDQDDDIDGDGMSNDFENDNGLDPYDESDADEDADGDGVSNRSEFDNGTDPNVDDYGPELILPEDVTVDATELFNLVDIGNPEAFDYVDSERVACCEDAVNDAPARFQPGTTEVLWTAADAAGNETTGIQLIHVRPLISFAPDFSVNEGNESLVTIYLNGESPQYPLEIPYAITGGSATLDEDYIWSSGVAIIESGTEIEIPISIVQDAEVEDNETILAEIAATVNRAAKFEIVITISEDNLPPEASLTVSQNNEINLQVVADGGLVGVSSEVTDPNSGDTHSYDWSQSDDRLVDQSGIENQFIFDPSNLELGGYRVELIVTDSGTPELSDTVTVNIQLVETIVEEDDSIACNLALEEVAVEDAFIVEAQAGICIERGVFSLNSELGGVWITDNDFANQAALIADETQNIGGRFDMTVSELQAMASQVTLVIPQRSVIIEETLYRVFINGIWQDFDLSNGDQVMSAPGALGFCPPPNDGAFMPGLNNGDYCVAISITDGGTNDGDGVVNGIIEATGGVHLQAEPEVIEPVEQDQQVDIVTIGGGDSGSTGHLLIFLLAGLFLIRRYSSQY